MVSETGGSPDGGWGWMCVLGKFCCYFFILGTASAFGVIYVDIIDYFDSTREEAAWIGSLTFGLTLLTGPLASASTSRFGIQKTTAAGTLVAFLGCFISWFATGIPYLYVSYGVILGVGLGLIFLPCILIVVQYFDKRLGLANGISSVGEGLGTLVLPPLYTYLLQEYGWRGTMLLLSGIVLHGFVCAVIFIPPPFLRGDTERGSSKSTTCQNISAFIHNPSLVVYIMATALAHLGYIVPFVHIPDMALQMGIEKYQGASLVSIMGVSNVVGRIIMGWISDLPCSNVIVMQAVSLIVCGVATGACPHLTDFYALAVYSFLSGALIGVFGSLLPVAIRVLVGLERTGDAFGLVMLLAGIMSTVASPLAGRLFDITKTYNASFYLAGSTFFATGVLFLLARVLQGKGNEEGKTAIPSVGQVYPPHQQENRQTLEQTYM